MWHEARRVEKQLRGMMVNFKKRAERRRAFYSRMKQDPIQLLRVYGHKCKIHIDAQVAAAAEHRSVMMPWQGQADNMIDRFDGRANLDFIPTTSSELAAGPLMETDPEQNRLNYERYKSLVMIGYSGVSEEDYLQQLAAEEMIPKKEPQSFDKKEKSAAKATIGYSYGDSSVPAGTTGGDDSNDSDDESDAESIPSDIDVTVDVDELSKQEMHEIDNVSMNYGMAPAQFCRKLKVDKVEAEEQKKIKEEEEERALMGGRRSRKDRRSARERLRHHNVKDSPPSYARRSSPTYEPYRSGSSSSSSRSCSPENAGQVEFITEFGATDDKQGGRADKITHSSLSRNKDQEHNSEKRQLNRSHEQSKRQRSRSRDRRRSRERSRSRSRGRRRSRGRSSSRNRNRSRDRSRSSSRNRNRSRDRSRSSSRDRYRIRERSRSSSRDRLRRKSRSRSSSRGQDRYRDDRNRESRESLRAKDTAKATAKLTGLSKDKKPVGDSKDKSKLTPQEKMKRRMQLLLNKQLKVDRKDERTKRDAKERERLNREDDLREMQKKWREGRRSPSPRSWSRRSRSRSPERSRHHSDTESPARPVPIVDFDQETRDEEVIHYVYDN